MSSAFQLHSVCRRKYKLPSSHCCTAGDLPNIFIFLSVADDTSSGKNSQTPEGSNGEYEDHSGKQWGKEQCEFSFCSWFSVAHPACFSVTEGKEKAEQIE